MPKLRKKDVTFHKIEEYLTAKNTHSIGKIDTVLIKQSANVVENLSC